MIRSSTASNGAPGRSSRRGLIVAAALLLATPAAPPAAASATQAGEPAAARRIVAIADIHGALDAFTEILQEAGLVDEALNWDGGDAILVQTGDFTDRGPDVRACMDLLMRLQDEAPDQGGEVIVLLGNHEAMNLIDYLRDGSPADNVAFVDADSENRREDAYDAWRNVRQRRADDLGEPSPRFTGEVQREWEEAHPLGQVERMAAFGPEGLYGRWLRSLPTVARLGNVIFMHAGLSTEYADRGIEEMNTIVADELRRFDEAKELMIRSGLITADADFVEIINTANSKAARLMATFEETGERPREEDRELVLTLDWILKYQSWELLRGEGLLWFRGLAQWPEDEHAADVQEILEGQGVDHIVVGHTTQADGDVKSRFGGALFLTDTGMLTEFYSGRPAALEIVDGRFTAIYPGERRQLYPPPQSPEPASSWLGADGVPLPFSDDDGVLDFLRTAEIVAIEDVGAGRTGARRVELVRDGVRARGIFHDVDYVRERIEVGGRFYAIFRDSWRGQVAAYRLARALGLGNVPPTVHRRIGDDDGSVQLWLENDGLRTAAERTRAREHPSDLDAWLAQQWVMNVFDALVFNDDRNPGNVLVDGVGTLWMIDHTRAFQNDPTIRDPDKLARLERGLRTTLRDLDREHVTTLLAPLLDQVQINALMARRDAILEHFDALIEMQGEASVLYDRSSVPAARAQPTSGAS